MTAIDNQVFLPSSGLVMGSVHQNEIVLAKPGYSRPLPDPTSSVENNSPVQTERKLDPDIDSQNRELSPELSLSPGLAHCEFCPSQITYLNITKLDVARNEIFRTGCLPKWICNFQQLAVLRASKMGIIIIEPWILELKGLKELYLEQNQISTWPHFLRELPGIEKISLDGNPCLEKAFHKSPTLRSRYFSWNADSTAYKAVPAYIRGVEWTPAASARVSSSANINHLGFYCGGIYTLGTDPNTSNDGLLTPLEPDPLFTRLHTTDCSDSSDTGGSPLSPSFEDSSFENLPASHREDPYVSVSQSVQDTKQTEILREIFDDIAVLLNRENYPKASKDSPRVQLVGSPEDGFNQLLSGEHERLSHGEMVKFCRNLIEEENAYLEKLKLVYREFLGGKIKNSNVSEWLGIVFEGFVAMTRIHSRWVLRSLKTLLHVSELGAKAARMNSALEAYGHAIEPRKRPEFSKDVIELLTFAFSQLKKAMGTYAKNIWRAEYLLDLQSAPTRLYENADFEAYVRSQMAKLGSIGGHLGSTFAGYSAGSFPRDLSSFSYKLNVTSLSISRTASTSSNAPPYSNSSSTTSLKSIAMPSLDRRSTIKDQHLKSRHTLSMWVDKQLQRSSPKIASHPGDFLYLPLMQLVRYERAFTSFYRSNPQFAPTLKILRSLRQNAAECIQEMRMHARCSMLARKFKTADDYFQDYQWDAVLAVRSRSYFEHGILSKKTSDVIDADGNPVSFVKEAFSPARMRILRLVCCGSNILLLDDVFEHFIGKTSKQQVIAIPTCDPLHPLEVRVLFVDAKETCLVEVKDFKARYHTHLQHHVEFMQACKYSCKIIV